MAKNVKTTSTALPSTDPVHMTEIVLPTHTNALGTIFGGTVVSWIDIAAAIAAQRYARSPVVTVSIDNLHFIVPIRLGHTVLIEARVSFVGTTSMEIYVQVHSENSMTGETKHALDAYLTFVALDVNGKPRKIPPLTPKTAEDRKRLKAAEERRALRLSR